MRLFSSALAAAVIVSSWNAQAAKRNEPVCFLHQSDAKTTQVILFDIKTQTTTIMAEGRAYECVQALKDLVESKHCRNGASEVR